MKSNARIDQKMETLINDVRSYSDPKDIIPAPPIDATPERRPFVEGPPAAMEGPDRQRPPEWFEPQEPFDDEVGDDSRSVPVIHDNFDVPEVSSAEDEIVATTGVEALAFYAPFHFYQRHRWGIYIRDFGLAYLASKFCQRQRFTTSDNWVLQCAYEFLLQHEYFHFQTELAVSRYEILVFQRTMYLDHVYLHHFLDRHSSWLEESVANAQAYRQFGQGAIRITSQTQIDQFRLFLAKWMDSQPPGYRDYIKWIGRGLKKGRSAITAHLHDSLRKWRGEGIVSDPTILDLYKEAAYSRIPIIRVPDARLPSLGSARQFPKAYGLQVAVYSNDHPPPHIHVDFLDGKSPVRVAWPSLQAFPNDRNLSRKEYRNLCDYLRLHQEKIVRRLQIVFGQPLLPAAAM